MHLLCTASDASAQGIFSRNQAIYAEHGVATFPVTKDKIPATRGYMHVGLAGSAKLAEKFMDSPALGFIAGQRSKITVLDVDTTDETVLSDALARHGTSPLIVRTGSGKFHAYYRHNGERRRIRPWADRNRTVPADQ
jgi:Bifunctional DNA primase/polymerase, N-terminal